MAEKYDKNRAVQFMPFGALKGFEDMIKECESVKEERKILLEDTEEEINYTLKNLKSGIMAEVVFYEDMRYKKVVGMIGIVDGEKGIISVVKKVIKTADIYSIEIL